MFEQYLKRKITKSNLDHEKEADKQFLLSLLPEFEGMRKKENH